MIYSFFLGVFLGEERGVGRAWHAGEEAEALGGRCGAHLAAGGRRRTAGTSLHELDHSK